MGNGKNLEEKLRDLVSPTSKWSDDSLPSGLLSCICQVWKVQNPESQRSFFLIYI